MCLIDPRVEQPAAGREPYPRASDALLCVLGVVRPNDKDTTTESYIWGGVRHLMIQWAPGSFLGGARNETKHANKERRSVNLVVGLLILCMPDARGGANSKAHFRVRFRHNTLARSVITGADLAENNRIQKIPRGLRFILIAT
jgi:hypothetical protein